nr:immunoglobulin heavy chain junction region [Macaca mulatta]MOX00198.1 immunoglobulin heavy chain junction region [Macaca mulatta]MOX00593.1 immunoglobulin heavy chain junction region [Macaca mulatta]MOX04786.1 immunoglobulin heavy chain junction region [Macaca mulatta]MOX07021.1 immunoglobulin heavy chain junction region [Macaca mulatta]
CAKGFGSLMLYFNFW